jgi:hypothetical protein
MYLAHRSFVTALKYLAYTLRRFTAFCFCSNKMYVYWAISHTYMDDVSETISTIRWLCDDGDEYGIRNVGYQTHIHRASRLRIVRCIQSPWKLQIVCKLLHTRICLYEKRKFITSRNRFWKRLSPFMDNMLIVRLNRTFICQYPSPRTLIFLFLQFLNGLGRNFGSEMKDIRRAVLLHIDSEPHFTQITVYQFSEKIKGS